MSAIDYASIARAVRLTMTGPRRLSAADAVRILATAFYGDDRWCLTINPMSDDEAAGRYATLWHPRKGSRSFTSTGSDSLHAECDLAVALILWMTGKREFATTEVRA